MFKRVPQERQLRVRQVYKSLFLRIQFMQNDVNLNSMLNVGSNVVHRRRFQMND